MEEGVTLDPVTWVETQEITVVEVSPQVCDSSLIMNSPALRRQSLSGQSEGHWV